MKEPVWVLHEVVIAVHQSLLAEHGGAPGIRDESLLESALSRSRQRFEYSDEPSIFELAASYCYGLANNHPFVDGNKRIALTIAALFLELNGYSLTAPEPNAVVIIEELAAGNLSEDDLSSWFVECSISNA
ncbi:MAG: type II toxin-antitoxin system death-on-curing family toxin [Candidatus Thiodiazotropha endolucinida]|uniref:Type II toxin-antitoxin system death-on-curing family toxin n=1 Tax=Candidatus Thiodiazotropha taylori TaxID=2792791 RepID=A0A9E4NIQ2_9GAMM|nr:type II toxin-antitoxin system death-on-curing family toxin [Candidatus Thiodiazotropha sp. (ex Codakia orbicularis)]MBV2126185.1 type II toxin-antitoxin system death-on-curing family toxin [Candidatus Thiodiazotropha taylori]MCG7978079.1 type II toxin-antitoxin system death-on-curing family toxin [Candidatus Thiodiazotropha taylori]MCW4236208.1 type II toxin-antitoxin system death-on-curing family toxin [Candidatus Thiodiazotropha endolucinida]